MVVSFNDSMQQLKDDPHIWLSPSAEKMLSKEISQALIETDPLEKEWLDNLQHFGRHLETP
jgi:ABC-type Zn uptake system ZnuABC Zn-binding protein ZnuA